MSASQFRDAVVRLASIKFPSLSRTEAATSQRLTVAFAQAVMRIFKNLKTFQGQTKDVFSQMDDTVLNLLGLARCGSRVSHVGLEAS